MLDVECFNSIESIEWKNSIVIFDEAHNLEGVANDSFSFSFSTFDVQKSTQEIDCCIENIAKFSLSENRVEIDVHFNFNTYYCNNINIFHSQN